MSKFPTLQFLPRNRCKIIMLHSQKGGPGKSTLAINIAHSLASKGKKTLLIDLDIAQPCLRDIIQMPKEKIKFTVNDVLLGREYILEELLLPTDYKNLYVMIADHDISYGEGLLALMDSIHEDSFYHLHDLIATLHKYGYEYTILDCAPGYRVEAVSSAIIADARVFVLKPSTFSFEGAKQLMDNIYKKFATTSADFLVFSQVPKKLHDKARSVLNKWCKELVEWYKPYELIPLGEIPLSEELIIGSMMGEYVITDKEIKAIVDNFTSKIEEYIEKIA